MLEALWSIEFTSNTQSSGAGVVIFETGRVFGGDAQYYYVGSYRNHENLIGRTKAEVQVSHYAGEPNSIFGLTKELNLVLEGEPRHDIFELTGFVKENPNLKVGIRFTRRAELP